MSIVYALFAVVLSWIFLRHDLGQPDETAVIISLSAAMILGLSASLKREFSILCNWWISVSALIALVTFAFLYGGWTEIVLNVAAIPFALRLLGHKNAFIEKRTDGAIVVSALLLLIAVIQPLLEKVALSHPEFDSVASLVAIYCRSVFEFASTLGATVQVSTGDNMYEFIANWESLACEPLLLIALGTTVLGILGKKNWRFFALAMATIILFAFVRFVGLISVAVFFEFPRTFAMTWSFVVSLLPLAPILALLSSKFEVVEEERRLCAIQIPVRRVALATLGLGMLIGGSWGFVMAYQDPGAKQTQRVLVDEGHSEWSWTDIPLNREQYGVLSVYNFRSLYDYLEYFYDIDRNEKKITKEVLEAVDVFVLKMPTKPFAKEEIDAIEDYVTNGGGLFVVGDHTNVFGTSLYANSVLERFDLSFNFDATYEIDFGNHTDWAPPGILAHPIVQHVPELTFASSCTVNAPLHADIVISGYEIKSAALDYSTSNFFTSSEHVLGHPHRFGRFIQGAAVQHGKGRVSVFTDSTMFSNFCLFLEGRPEMVLGYVDWSGRGNKNPGLRGIFLWVGLLMVLALALLAWRQRSFGILGIAMVSAGCMAGVTVLLLSSQSQEAYAEPTPRKEIPYVTFDLGHSVAMEHAIKYFPTYPRSISDSGYSTLFIWAQRAGLVPKVTRNLMSELDSSQSVVLVQPSREFDAEEIAGLTSFVKDGGKLAIFDDLWNPNKDVSRGLLKNFGFNLSAIQDEGVELQDETGKTWGNADRPMAITGGTSWLSIKEGECVLAHQKVGKGEVIASGISRAFSDKKLGFYKSLPNDDQRKRAELVYAIYDRLGGKTKDMIVSESELKPQEKTVTSKPSGQ